MRTVMLILAAIVGLSALSVAAPTPAEAQYYGGGYGYYKSRYYYKPRYYAPPPPVYYAPRPYYAPRYGY